MGLIIPVSYLAKVLPSDATDSNSEQTNAVTEASAFVNTYTSKHYETWDGYTGTSTYTLHAPREICYITTQLAKHMYYMNIGSVVRAGSEDVDREARVEYYRNMLEKIDVKPTQHMIEISLDDRGYQLIARNQNILTHKGHIDSATGISSSSGSSSSSASSDSDSSDDEVATTTVTSTVWNLGKHFYIIKGGCIDAEEYWNDGWYLDASTYKDSISGYLYYWRSYRNDGRDYIASYRNDRDNS
jgi:hypothetical protein